MHSQHNDEQQALAAFGIKKFNSEKFENSDENSVLVQSPVDSKGIDEVMSAFHAEIPVEHALPKSEDYVETF
ncbi:MAG: hypothetical protein FWG73_03700 [Planctomycetaceae bacterium]|nr:hypothetical protein [Planctomycetaceae bacterium]